MTKILAVEELKEGMIVSEDVLNKDTGVILIAKDTNISKLLIERLNIHGIRSIKIKKEEKPYNYNKDLMISYSKVTNKLEDIFSDVKSFSRIDSNEVYDEMKDFTKEILKERDIVTQMKRLSKKDDYTFNHSLGVSMLAISLGKWAKFSQEEIFELSMVGLFHDLGKLRISNDIINKPGKLSKEEFDEMKKHPIYAYDMLVETGDFNESILLGVLQHHEKLDGSGYPYKLKAYEICEYARVIAICDIYHALISKRSYKDKENPLRVADYLKKESFSSLDPKLTHIFLENVSKFYVGSRVLLSSGDIGTIIYVYPQDRTKVIVNVGGNFINFLEPQKNKIVEIVL